MEKKVESVSAISHTGYLKINSASRIIDVTHEGEYFNIEYFQSEFDNEIDIYQFHNLTLEELGKNFWQNQIKGYTFYASSKNSPLGEEVLLFGKQISREKVKWLIMLLVENAVTPYLEVGKVIETETNKFMIVEDELGHYMLIDLVKGEAIMTCISINTMRPTIGVVLKQYNFK